MDSAQDLPFRFLSLPQELRDDIYSDILTTTYVVDLTYRWIYLAAREYGQLPPIQNCASSHLAILRVSKSVHAEAKQVLFRLSTFRFVICSTGLPLSQGLGAVSVATLMQNMTVQLGVITGSADRRATPLQPAISALDSFRGSRIPRAICVIQVRFGFFSDSLLGASFLDALGKLTGFKPVFVTLRAEDVSQHAVRNFESSTYKTLDKYLKVMLAGWKSYGESFGGLMESECTV